MRRPPARLALLLLLALGTGCEARSGTWSFEFACPELERQAHSLAVRIARGTCAEPAAVVYEGHFEVSQRGPAPPELAPGGYAFLGEARSADGAAIGTGCTDAALPEGREVRVTISDAARCMDAGAPLDAARPDATTGDDDAGGEPPPESDAGAGTCVRFADARANPSGADGLSFATALPDLQAAIDAAAAASKQGCEVWVRAGTYYVYRDSIDDTLALRPGVALYGGFSGGETKRSERDLRDHPTVLSGLRAAGASDRVLHVVTGADRARLDGFTVADGNATSAAAMALSGRIRGLGGGTGEDPSGFGGGLLNLGGSLTIANCTFRNNAAARCGGAIAATNGKVLVEDARFETNQSGGAGGAICSVGGEFELRRSEFATNAAMGAAGTGGGAIYAQAGTLVVGDALFHANIALDDGGAVLLESQANGSFVNCTFSTNRADAGDGGAIYNRQATLRVQNGILWSDSPDEFREMGRGTTSTFTYSDVMGGTTGPGNLDLDPRFVSPLEGDFRLAADSPCIDSGLGTGASPRDLSGNARRDAAAADRGAGSPPYVDLGAFELQP